MVVEFFFHYVGMISWERLYPVKGDNSLYWDYLVYGSTGVAGCYAKNSDSL